MEPFSSSEPPVASTGRPAPAACQVCHQPVLPSYYFCPNCGAPIRPAPLSTTPATQAWIYALSVALPLIAFLAISKWPGLKYIRSKDKEARRIGMIAWALLIVSTIAVVWYTVVWTEQYIQATVSGINADMSGLGG